MCIRINYFRKVPIQDVCVKWRSFSAHLLKVLAVLLEKLSEKFTQKTRGTTIAYNKVSSP